jgi:hypothetical protein
MRRVVSIAIAAVAWLALASATVAREDVWVAVRGPQSGFPSESLRLEVGTQTYVLSEGFGGGVVAVETDRPVWVFLTRLSDCEVVASIRADVGERWVIRFGSDGSIVVEDWTAQGLDAGPGIEPRSDSRCPPSTDTITPTADPAPPSGWPALISGLAVASVVLLALRRRVTARART